MEILDELPLNHEQVQTNLTTQKKIYAIFAFIISIPNGLILGLQRDDASIPYLIGNVIAAIIWCCVGGLFFGSLIALIPYKGLHYRQKFSRSFLIGYIISGIIILIASILMLMLIKTAVSPN